MSLLQFFGLVVAYFFALALLLGVFYLAFRLAYGSTEDRIDRFRREYWKGNK